MVLLDELPVELLHLILHYLPVPDLISFATTSKSSRTLSLQCLTTLDLAIFPRRIHSLLSFFDSLGDDEDEDDNGNNEGQEDPPVSKYWARQAVNDKTLCQVGLITPKVTYPPSTKCHTSRSSTTLSSHQPDSRRRNRCSTSSSRSSSASRSRPTPLSIRTAEIDSQNTFATQVLQTSFLANLRTLTLRLYDISQPQLASTLATSFPNLTALNLEFCHPYIHDTTLPSKYWRDTVPVGSPIWNVLAGVGDEHADILRLRSLRSLKVSRSGITPVQLRTCVENNPELHELWLGLCRGVDKEFVQWLGEYAVSKSKNPHDTTGKGKLEVVRLTDCPLLELRRHNDDNDDGNDSEIDNFTWVDQLARSGVTGLSLRGCKSVDETTFLRLATTRWIEMGMQRIVSPKGVVIRPSSHSSTNVSVGRRRVQGGSASPALTVSDGMMQNGSGLSCLGKIEIDPAVVL